MAVRRDTLRAENEELRLRLEEAEEALEAIRTGKVESLVVDGPGGPRIFSLEGATDSYRVLVESMNEGAATLGDDGTILYCNGRFAALLGEPLQRVMGSPLSAHLPERSRGALEQLLERAREASAREELPLLEAGGHEIPAYLSISPIVDAGSRVLCLVATDLREQRRNEAIAAAEYAARESEEKLRLTLRYAAAGTWEWDLRSGAVGWSPETYQLYGRDPSGGPFGYGDWKRAIHADDIASMQAATAACVDGRTPEFRVEYRVAHPMLGERWLLAIGKCERADDGTAVRMLGLNIDITERRRVEEALRASEERLSIAADELRAADRAKDDFLGMLSHELRNPLAPIRNSVHILKRADQGSERARRAQDVIERQIDHLTRLVDDLLDVTRIARGKIELRRERLDLRDVVLRAADDFRVTMEERGVAFHIAVPPSRAWADADPTRLNQVIGNLLHNAAKFTRRGDEVTLTLVAIGSEAEISVRDTGAGVDPGLLASVFRPFVQGERTLARSEGGLGLGLALVKGIAELHGGAARVESAGRGKGATFAVRLPLEATVPDESTTASAAPPVIGRRILVVDDNTDSAQSLAELLKLQGHDVDVAYDGPSAVERATTTAPDVVLCDIGLPGMSGYDVAKTLRSRSNEVRLFALSGYAQPEDVRRALEAGFDGHLAKPADPLALARLLAR